MEGQLNPKKGDSVSILQEDTVGWLKNLNPGLLINKLLTDIGGFTEEEWKKKKN
jgi:hypothetical protein